MDTARPSHSGSAPSVPRLGEDGRTPGPRGGEQVTGALSSSAGRAARGRGSHRLQTEAQPPRMGHTHPCPPLSAGPPELRPAVGVPRAAGPWEGQPGVSLSSPHRPDGAAEAEPVTAAFPGRRAAGGGGHCPADRLQRPLLHPNGALTSTSGRRAPCSLPPNVSPPVTVLPVGLGLEVGTPSGPSQAPWAAPEAGPWGPGQAEGNTKWPGVLTKAWPSEWLWVRSRVSVEVCSQP